MAMPSFVRYTRRSRPAIIDIEPRMIAIWTLVIPASAEAA
jgi:hypothetical protein